ncbi:hypothetical protein AALG83_01390 [Christensenellaceae bacterium 44-20]
MDALGKSKAHGGKTLLSSMILSVSPNAFIIHRQGAHLQPFSCLQPIFILALKGALLYFKRIMACSRSKRHFPAKKLSFPNRLGRKTPAKAGIAAACQLNFGIFQKFP